PVRLRHESDRLPGQVRARPSGTSRCAADTAAPYHSRARGRPRLRGALPAAVVGAARGRVPAPGAPAVRCHAHDTAGGRGGEPAPASDRVPLRGPWPFLTAHGTGNPVHRSGYTGLLP